MRLTVFGCSFGDYLNGRLSGVYGEYLARQLGLTYQHESAGGGSNHRMWRRYWQLDQQGLIDDQDIVIIQYTQAERCEFHRVRPPYNSWNRPADDRWPPGWNEEPLADGVMLRWKSGADEWANTAVDRDFFRAYQKHYVSAQWAEQDFQWRHRQFVWALQGQGRQRVIFLKNRIRPQIELPQYYDQISYHEPSVELQQSQYCFEPGDVTHMNEQGHQRLAQYLAEHIMRLGWLGS